jgi:3-hydroxyacyl-[acyl-carrier-protein] dehydratase
MSFSPDPDILEQIRTLVRRDLKLGAGEPLPIDMPFFGGDIDLDSLDILLLVTSIERQFGVSISDGPSGKEAFQSIGSLVGYVQQHRGEAKSSGPLPAAKPIDWLSRLPHGSEFRFISRVTQVTPGQAASGVWELNGTEAFFAGHFPGNPVVPGVLITEALAQVSGLASAPAAGAQGRLAQIDVRFEQSAAPPVAVELSAKVVGQLGSLRSCEVAARVGDRVLARGVITLHHSEG